MLLRLSLHSDFTVIGQFRLFEVLGFFTPSVLRTEFRHGGTCFHSDYRSIIEYP